MLRRIAYWVLLGTVVACCWVVIAALAGPTHNLGRAPIAAITAPASLLGRTMPLNVISFVFLNGCLYGVLGLTIYSLHWTCRSR